MPESPEDDLDDGDGDAVVYAARRLVLDLPESVLQTLNQIAEYRNALAVGGASKRLRGAWSRKSLAEHILRRAAKELRKEVAPVQESFGPFPTIDLDKAGEEKERARFREAMAAYVRRVGRGKK